MIKKNLTQDDYNIAAWRLSCSPEAIKAVASVESMGAGFLPSGEPKILFEPHVFSRLTNNKYDKSHPKTSYKKWGTYPYGTVSSQHGRLAEAAKLDRNAALQSTSWGEFQIMGFNYGVCGYKSVQELVNDAYRGVDGHLEMFVRYVIGRRLDDELRRLDWAGFAYGYNGAGYAQNHYDTKMAAAYNRFNKS